MTKPRARDLGLPFRGTPGRFNAITDVAGVKVGFTTLTDQAKNMRTGVTAILPRDEKGSPSPVWAGFHSFNGNGEMTGTHWVNDAGYFLGPVMITNSHGIGAVHHGATRWMIEHYDTYFTNDHAWAMPVVAETYDGLLNDINALHVTPDHAIEALKAARSGAVAEGSTGGGNGMIAYGFKGGTGTSSRLVEIGGKTYTVGVLVQANYGKRADFTVLGVPVGKEIPAGAISRRDMGSIIVVIATDAPMSDANLRQLAKRGTLGIGRTGTSGGYSSGDLFFALSVADPVAVPPHAGPVLTRQCLNWEELDPIYDAAVDATDEAILNAIVAGEDVESFKPKGQVCHALDTTQLLEIMRAYGRGPVA